ncbi:hypothetical protein [Nonomuraea turcica]|uniref:hypothetical protein n=1 Tax=Nonomuraea sp. G32 TaxID=3067274 RepID=UPI00273B69F4|nr:hypothetical protein [Nonomuraea sp. G32]MDP4506731.1 hypothetical protein [Nonomuraea sp. G32]
MRRRWVWAAVAAIAALAVVVAAVVVLRGRAATSEQAGDVRVVAREQGGERAQDLTVQSPALGTTTPVRVLLPRGWMPGSGP